MNILGLSCHYHDAAACLIQDGKIVTAVEEERFSRKKHDNRFPRHAIAHCLKMGGISIAGIDLVAFYEKPSLKLERRLLVARSLALGPQDLDADALAQETREAFSLPQLLADVCGYHGPVRYFGHHQSHAASAFFTSPFEEAAVLTVDGVGEWATTSLFHGAGGSLRSVAEVRYPHSLGLFYAAITAFLGFKVNDDEYKVMGLSAYGQPTFYNVLADLIEVRPDGGLMLDLDYFSFGVSSGRMFRDELSDLLGPPRAPEEPIVSRHENIACSLQAVTEDIILRLARHARAVTGAPALCMAGGVALNCLANSRVLESGIFDGLHIQPAAGDGGGALGAALLAAHGEGAAPRRPLPLYSTRLGPAYDDDVIEAELVRQQLAYRRLPPDALCAEVAERLYDGMVVGWFQGPMEFGPRALGGRSILASPLDAEMVETLNLRIKHREPFRPFAPAVLEEEAAEWFDLTVPSRHMLLTPKVRRERRDRIPAVVHVDGTARAQTVSKEENPLFHRLISAFKRISGAPVIVNTSFNVRGEPIVCTPADAVRCFLFTDIDHLAIGSFLVDRDAA